MSETTTVTLSVQWALHGKLPGDTQANRVLSWSAGDIGKKNFTELIGRFDPGTLDALPQVTVNWLVLTPPAQPGQPERAPVTYLALAILDEPSGLRDASRQKIELTRYFAVPYVEMAARAVSYHAVYAAVRSFALPAACGPALLLPVEAVPPPAPSPGDLASRVASLLLTGRPVCVLGGQALAVDERLRFIDTVMSLLPYGIRTKMTAATWASATKPHRFRLFFAGAPRAENDSADHNVHWGQPERAEVPAGYPDALAYMGWLEEAVSQPMAELSGMDGEYGFTGRQVLRILETLGIREPGAGEALAGYADGQDARALSAPRLLGLRARSSKGVAERILLGINDLAAAGDKAALRVDITALSRFAGTAGADSDRAMYQGIVFRCQLLRPELALGKLAGLFYTAVLRLAFGLPLSYEGYCQLESCLGAGSPPDPPPPRPLLDAIERGGLGDPVVAILVLSQLGGQSLDAWLRFGQFEGQELIAKAVAPALRPYHARQVCDAIREYLQAHQRNDRQELLPVLRDHQFLAPAVQRSQPADPPYQARFLAAVLDAAYGKRIGKQVAVSILGETVVPPTPALLKAVVGMLADPADRDAAMQAFALGSLKSVESKPG